MLARWILAAANPFQSYQKYQKQSFSLKENWLVLVVVEGIVALGIGLYYWDKYRKRFIQRANSSGNPKSLFLDLCNLHELTRAECSLVRQAGKAKHLAEPALAFLDPQILGELAQENGGEAAAYAQLSIKLFGTPQTATTSRQDAVPEASPSENTETVAS